MATTLTADNKAYLPKSWEVVPCPFCGDDKYRIHEYFGPEEKYRYVQCRHCQLIYSSPRPKYDAEFVETAYEVYDTQSHHIKNKGILNEGEKALVERHKITLSQIEVFLRRKGKILDIGCATGLFLYAAREIGWSVCGLDISPSMTDFLQKGFQIKAYCGQYHELDLSADGPFDVIHCSHVIEHIPNPNAWMQKFKTDLLPDGILVLNVPNQYSIDRIFKRGLKTLGVSKDKWDTWRTPDHLYEPHKESMEYFIENNGFERLDYFTYSSRETDRPGFSDRLLHKKLKWGSKLRYFLRPVT